MKKILFILIIFVGFYPAFSQPIFRVLSPIDSNYTFTWAKPSTGGWATPDWNDCYSGYVSSSLELVDDGAPGINAQGHPVSQEGCNTLTNDLTGRIAVVYRGTCPFSTKALNAQNAGAFGVIVINRDPEVIEMGAGTSGSSVTIPVVMLSNSDGAALVSAMNHVVHVYMGPSSRGYLNNVSINSSDALISKYGSIPYDMASKGYSFKVGLKVRNSGFNSQSNCTVNASITDPNGTVVYNHNVQSSGLNICSEFNAYDPSYFPDYTMTNPIVGKYTLTYTAAIDGANDEMNDDNLITSSFYVTNDVLSLARQDEKKGEVLANSFPTNSTVSEYSACMKLQDVFPSNLNRLSGLDFVIESTDPTIQNAEIDVQILGFSTVSSTVTDNNLYELAHTEYYYSHSYDTNMVNVSFFPKIALKDNTPYLICLTTYTPNIRFGYDKDIRYDANNGNYGYGGIPVSPVKINGIWYSVGWPNIKALSLGVKLDYCSLVPVNQTINPIVCGNYISLSGRVYNQTGIYHDTVYSVFGCDSLYQTINLTILNSSSSFSVSLCSVGTYTWNGQQYTQPGQYTQTLKNQFGCDSVVTLDLIVPYLNSSFSASLCSGDTYTWNGQQYTQPGLYTQHLKNQFGCDSVVTLNLNVIYNDYININPNPAFGNAPLNVAFANQTPNLSNYNFTWFFGDGTSQQSNAPFLSHIYTQNGYADVTVVADNLNTGCRSSQTFNDMIFVIGGVTCTHTATINQTGPLNGCVGDSLFMSCNTDPSFTYQWNRNGIPVSGASNSSYYPTQSGSYTVTIYQNNCPVTSAGISVTINPLPSVPTITSSGTITPCSGGSMTLTAPSGFTSYLWNTGSTTSSLVVSQSGSYFVSVTNSNGCSRTSNPFDVNASSMISPQVCIVGMDSLTNQNRVVWEKPLTQGIDSFYVYKESNVSNVYTKIGATDFKDLAVFIDINSNPSIQAYRYKISALDTCGVETNLGDFHKTIHLTINQGIGGAWNLIWSHYEGLNFGSYNIYRGTDPLNIALLTTIQSNLNSYSDLTPPAGPLYYQIEVVNPVNCDPTKSINYGVSRSNVVKNGLLAIKDIENTDIFIYPNPTNNNITLEVSSEMVGKTYSIKDFSGRTIRNGKITSTKELIDLHEVTRGAYFLSIDNGSVLKKLIKH